MAALAAAFVSVAVMSTTATADRPTEEEPMVDDGTIRELPGDPAEAHSTPAADSHRPRAAGRKLVPDDDYRTLSSAASELLVRPPTYPSLTTGPPAGFAMRSRHIGNPFGIFSKDDQEMEFDDDHQHADFVSNGGGGGMPKWNRYTKSVL